jgi:hypothetical protein
MRKNYLTYLNIIAILYIFIMPMWNMIVAYPSTSWSALTAHWAFKVALDVSHIDVFSLWSYVGAENVVREIATELLGGAP